MQLPEICIKRPVFATVLSLIILLIGLISYTRLSVREYPRIDEPVVSVNTTYRGASAEVVEIHRGPAPGGYGEMRRLTAGATVSPQAFPDMTLPLTEIFA